MSNLRSKILKTAHEQLEENGYDRVTMRSIATSLRVTHPALYTYFKNKEDLFSALKAEVFTELKEYLFKDLNPHGTFKDIMQAVSGNFIDFMERRKTHYQILFLIQGNGRSSKVQLQILEYIDALLVLPDKNINLPQLFWYSLLGHAYMRYMGEITHKKLHELIYELVDRLSQTQ